MGAGSTRFQTMTSNSTKAIIAAVVLLAAASSAAKEVESIRDSEISPEEGEISLHDLIVPETTSETEDDADEEIYGGNEMAADELLLQVKDKKGKKNATKKPIMKQQAGPEAKADVTKSRTAAKKAF